MKRKKIVSNVIFGLSIQLCLIITGCIPASYEINFNDLSTYVSINCMIIDSSDNIYLSGGSKWSAATGGVIKSSDNGDSWFHLIYSAEYTSALVIDLDGNIFIGTEYIGVYKLLSDGKTWYEVYTGQPNRISCLITESNENIIVGTYGQGVWVLNATENSINQTNLTNKWIYSLASNSNGDIFAGSAKGILYRTTDKGNSWTQLIIESIESHIQSLAINLKGDIFAGTYGDGVFRSTDNGHTWSEINNGFDGDEVWCLAINIKGHIFAGTNSDGFFRSTDNGDSWKEIKVSSSDVRSIVFNSKGHIFAGTSAHGVFYSTDNGDSWIPKNNYIKYDKPYF